MQITSEDKQLSNSIEANLKMIENQLSHFLSKYTMSLTFKKGRLTAIKVCTNQVLEKQHLKAIEYIAQRYGLPLFFIAKSRVGLKIEFKKSNT